MKKLRLGVNIDHVATVRNARGGMYPDPIQAAKLVKQSGADGITAHLREDRRHIRDADIFKLKEKVDLPLNFEMAATDEMLKIACEVKPNACCLVPEKREELTTEGGLDVASNVATFKNFAASLKENNIRVSLFIDPDQKQIDAASEVGADIIELHTGRYADTENAQLRRQELERIQVAATYAHEKGIEVHAGHGLTYDNVLNIAAIPELVELNIGHFLIAESVYVGLGQATINMINIINKVRRHGNS